MTTELAREISERLNLREVMEFYGVQFNGRGFAKCPFHEEKTPSLSIKNEHYKCFGCGAYGGVIDFIMNYHGIKFRQALVKLDTDFALGLIRNHKPTLREQREAAENKRISDAKVNWETDIHNEYLSLCEVHSILYRRFINGEEWLENIVTRIDILLDDFTGEEARLWEMTITM